MGRFLTPLRVEQVTESVTARPCWRLLESLVYYSNSRGYVIVPKGFVTDFATVPRLPFIFLLFGGRGDKQAVLHDYLYTAPHRTQPVDPKGNSHGLIVDRSQADCIYRGSLTDELKYDPDVFDNFFIRYMIAHGVSFSMWAGVRAIGWRFWGRK